MLVVSGTRKPAAGQIPVANLRTGYLPWSPPLSLLLRVMGTLRYYDIIVCLLYHSFTYHDDIIDMILPMT